MKDTEEYREVMVRTAKIRSKIFNNMSKKSKSRHIMFPMRMEKITEEPDVYRSLFRKIEAEVQKEEEEEDNKVREVIKGEIGNHFTKYVGWIKKDGYAKANECQREFEQRLEGYKIQMRDICSKCHQLGKKEESLYREVRSHDKGT